MNKHTRNNMLIEVFEHITSLEDYFLGFKYDPMTQIGSCNCANTGFKRFPMFKVRHDEKRSVIDFTSHHGDTARVSVIADTEFYFTALNKIKAKLQPYAGDWNDSATNMFHPDYKEGGDLPPSEG